MGEMPDINDEDDEIDDDDEDGGIEIVIDDDGDWDEEDIKELEVHLNKLQKFAEKHLIGKGKKSYSKQKNQILRQIKSLAEEINMLLLSNAFIKTDTYPGYLRKREELRKGLLKSLLDGEDEDAKIIIVQDLLRDVIGDDEPIDYYIF